MPFETTITLTVFLYKYLIVKFQKNAFNPFLCLVDIKFLTETIDRFLLPDNMLSKFGYSKKLIIGTLGFSFFIFFIILIREINAFILESILFKLSLSIYFILPLYMYSILDSFPNKIISLWISSGKVIVIFDTTRSAPPPDSVPIKNITFFVKHYTSLTSLYFTDFTSIIFSHKLTYN